MTGQLLNVWPYQERRCVQRGLWRVQRADTPWACSCHCCNQTCPCPACPGPSSSPTERLGGVGKKGREVDLLHYKSRQGNKLYFLLVLVSQIQHSLRLNTTLTQKSVAWYYSLLNWSGNEANVFPLVGQLRICFEALRKSHISICNTHTRTCCKPTHGLVKVHVVALQSLLSRVSL